MKTNDLINHMYDVTINGLRVGDYCKLKSNVNLPNTYPESSLSPYKKYQIRSIEAFGVSLVGVNEEGWIEGYGMTERSYFPELWFERYE